ncbi:MAG: hypothetical protein D3903_13755 [Candidatus Electrothrix sp. GM3_4]|nr:hypothetical protein [Candidatus Electrothrix sp. GM3_4]
MALLLLKNFRKYNPDITIKCILTDALYGSEEFMSGASAIFEGIQVVSQLRANQNIRYKKGVEK